MGTNAADHQAIFSLAGSRSSLLVGTCGGGLVAYSSATLANISGRLSPVSVAVAATANASVYSIEHLEDAATHLLVSTTCYKAAGCLARVQGPSVNVIRPGALGGAASGTLNLPSGRMASALRPLPEGGLVVGLSTGFYGIGGGLILFSATALRTARAPFILNASGSLGESRAAVDGMLLVGNTLYVATEQDGVVAYSAAALRNASNGRPVNPPTGRLTAVNGAQLSPQGGLERMGTGVATGILAVGTRYQGVLLFSDDALRNATHGGVGRASGMLPTMSDQVNAMTRVGGCLAVGTGAFGVLLFTPAAISVALRGASVAPVAKLEPANQTMNALAPWGDGGLAVGTGMDGVYLYSPAAVERASAGTCGWGMAHAGP
eukprot:CAMPEP_0119315156 /NCGR_PEP_ID=MMETSP1333-20130426/34631_1 /TAXON_ID=418940 /ORGANISM="Scyphosphaera apsteinii, Strain RCC1455" /LENGTH=376 /DNA_ID=CAMNT_0007320417 /DNA_START=263 /DNA_END=1393 /DNA_ORIENTATION=+